MGISVFPATHVGPQSRTFKIYGIPRINPQLLRQACGPEAGPTSFPGDHHFPKISQHCYITNVCSGYVGKVYSDVSDMIGYITKNYHVQPDYC